MNCRLSPSPIHGVGVFATKRIEIGQEIDYLSLIQGGQFLGFNHSCSPNIDQGRIFYIATKVISAGEELVIAYRRTPPNCQCGCQTHKD